MSQVVTSARGLLEALVARGLARSIRGNAKAVGSAMVDELQLELAVVADSDEGGMRARWREGGGSLSSSYLVIADDPNRFGAVLALGPTRPDGPIRSVGAGDAINSLREACRRGGLEGIRYLTEQLRILDASGSRIRGVQVNGLLTDHTLTNRLQRNARRWEELETAIRGVTNSDHWRTILSQLGYRVERRGKRGYILRHNQQPIAVVHPKADPNEFARLDVEGRPPEGVLVQDCRATGAPYGILAHQGRFRLFDATSATATAEWIDIDTSLLAPEGRPFLGLLSSSYLAADGLQGLREEARTFGVTLRKRLDNTIRQSALPALARGLGEWAKANGWEIHDDQSRLELERASLTLIFRLLFLLYAESSGFLPVTNRAYQRASLTSLVTEAAETRPRLSAGSTALWSRFVILTKSMRSGNPAWEVPAYNGSLFAEEGFEGAELLERLEIGDPDFAEVLIAVGRDSQTGGGVDFSTLEIGHLGYIYESLLSLRLSVADRPLRYDPRTDRYAPADSDAEVQSGSLLWQTDEGGRKAGGVYYTPAELVHHLVKGAVLPAFRSHLIKVQLQAKDNPMEAARELFRFSVVDPACGSAHFLVQVVDGLAEETVRFLADKPLPGITEALDRLRAGAMPGVAIDDVALLRRLLLKHCVFGVDISPMGAEIASISLWLASFVPGLSLSYLKRNVVVGNSLVGVADPALIRRQGSFWDDQLRDAMEKATRAASRLAQIEDRTPEEYQASVVADAEAYSATEGLKRLFDLWTAEGFGLDGARVEAESYPTDLIEGRLNSKRRQLVEKAAQLAQEHSFLHWPLAFPRVFSAEQPGFDVVVGNPPWEEVTVEELAFYGRFRPGINSLSELDREVEIQRLLSRRPELPSQLSRAQEKAKIARASLASGEYEPMSGDPDLYKYFCQRYRVLVRKEGTIGVVLPRTAFINKGSEGFRRWLLTRVTTRRVDFLLNRKRWVFDTHPQYTVALVVAEHREPPEDHRLEVAGTATSAEEWRKQSESPGIQIGRQAFGPRLAPPLLRSQREADLLTKLRVGTYFPLGIERESYIFAGTDLHETNDRRLWRDFRLEGVGRNSGSTTVGDHGREDG